MVKDMQPCLWEICLLLLEKGQKKQKKKKQKAGCFQVLFPSHRFLKFLASVRKTHSVKSNALSLFNGLLELAVYLSARMLQMKNEIKIKIKIYRH